MERFRGKHVRTSGIGEVDVGEDGASWRMGQDDDFALLPAAQHSQDSTLFDCQCMQDYRACTRNIKAGLR